MSFSKLNKGALRCLKRQLNGLTEVGTQLKAVPKYLKGASIATQ
jgi:hypothetical protein